MVILASSPVLKSEWRSFYIWVLKVYIIEKQINKPTCYRSIFKYFSFILGQ